MNKQIYTIGDLHGELEKLKSCLEKVPLNKGDRIIQLGDVVDRGPDSYSVIEYLLKLKEDYEMIFIKGNHDECFYKSIKSGENNLLWKQGARETLKSYIRGCNPEKEIVEKFSGYYTDFDYDDYPRTHINFFENQLLYYIDEERNYFVHGGFNRHHFIYEQPDPTIFTWDRDLFHCAMSYEAMKDKTYPFKIKGKPKEVFIGHTPTIYWNKFLPIRAANIWNLDTGCGKGNYPLTIMNIKTKEIYQA